MRQMNMSILRCISRFVLVLTLVLELSCVGRRITKANVDEVAEGMSKKQVESILGPPTELDNKDFVIMKKTTYVYRQGQGTVTIVFKDDKVTEKQSTLTNYSFRRWTRRAHAFPPSWSEEWMKRTDIIR